MYRNCSRSLAVLLFLAMPLRAEFILDDFDDPAEVVSPEMEGDQVFTENVGMLGARRMLRISGTQANPIASLDSGITDGSTLTGVMADLRPEFVNGTPLSGLYVWYDEFISDFTEEGRNDALLFDFVSITGPTPSSFFRVFAQETTNDGLTWVSRIRPVPTAASPITLAMPFDSFVVRGGAVGGADFQTMRRLGLEFFANGFFGEPEELGWSIQLDKIRVGRIPEPATLGLAIGLSLFASCMFRRRGPAQ